MKKYIFFVIFIINFTLINTANWFFPEYEAEITKRWKSLIEKITNQSLSSNEEFISSAKKIIENWKVKNKKDKIILDEFIMIMDREPVALNTTGMVESSSSTETLQSNLVSLASISSTYNRTNAVNYAINWAYGRNPSYNFYIWKNDCTNFTSQVLQTWWLPYIVSWLLGKIDKKNWYYANTSNAEPSYTWWWANNFFEHAKYYTNRFSSALTYWEMQIWDLIQIDWTKDWTIDHSMVITSKTWTSTSQIYVTYHSTDTLNKKLSDLISQYPNANYFWWKVIY